MTLNRFCNLVIATSANLSTDFQFILEHFCSILFFFGSSIPRVAKAEYKLATVTLIRPNPPVKWNIWFGRSILNLNVRSRRTKF